MVVSPLTGCQAVTLLETIDTGELARDWKTRFNIDVADELGGHKEIYLYQCNQTKLKFFVPPDLSGFPRFYESLQKYDWYYMSRKWEHDVAIQDMRRGDRVLEVGCGVGDFVERLLVEEKIDAVGTELNAAAVAEAVKRGRPVYFKKLEDMAIEQSGSFDVVCSFQVLEHAPNPKAFLESSCALIQPGGKLLLGLPNAESFLKYQFNILDMPPHHMTRWSSRVLNHLHKFFPLNLEHVKLEPLAEYHVNGYVTAYCFALAKYSFVQNLCRYRPRQLISKFIKSTGIRRLLTGQSMYASFTRI